MISDGLHGCANKMKRVNGFTTSLLEFHTFQSQTQTEYMKVKA